MSFPEIQKIVIKVPRIPEPPPKKKPKTRTEPKRPPKMDWSCAMCESMMCLKENFNPNEAKRKKQLPKSCPLSSPHFQSEIAIQNLLRVNVAIRETREAIGNLQIALRETNREEASLAQERHRQLKTYWSKITITKVTEKKRKKKVPPPVPTFKITVTSVQK